MMLASSRLRQQEVSFDDPSTELTGIPITVSAIGFFIIFNNWLHIQFTSVYEFALLGQVVQNVHLSQRLRTGIFSGSYNSVFHMYLKRLIRHWQVIDSTFFCCMSHHLWLCKQEKSHRQRLDDNFLRKFISQVVRLVAFIKKNCVKVVNQKKKKNCVKVV